MFMPPMPSAVETREFEPDNDAPPTFLRQLIPKNLKLMFTLPLPSAARTHEFG